MKTKFWQSRNFWQFKNPSYNNLDTFKSLFLTWSQTRHSILKVSKPKSQQLRNSWQLQNQVLIEPLYLKVSIFDMVSIKSLNFDNFNIQVSTVKNFFTVSIPKSQQSHYPKVSIFGMVLIVSLNLNCFKTHDLTVEKFVTVEIFFTVLKPKSW